MTELKEYYLSVNKDDLIQINQAMNILLGYVTAKVKTKFDPVHGPVDPEADLLEKCLQPLRVICLNISLLKDFAIDNEVVKKAQKELLTDIVATIQDKESSIDLLLRLIKTIENYEIIGRKKYEKEEELPF